MSQSSLFYSSELCKIWGANPFELDYLKKVYNREFKQDQELTAEQIKRIHGRLKKMKPPELGERYELTDSKIEINDDEPDPRIRGIKHEETVVRFLTARGFTVGNYQEKYIKELKGIRLKLYSRIEGLIRPKNEKKIYLLEIKIRKKNRGLRPWEHFQIQINMYLSRMNEALFVEVCEGEVEIVRILKDREYIRNMNGGLRLIYKELNKLRRGTEQQPAEQLSLQGCIS